MCRQARVEDREVRPVSCCACDGCEASGSRRPQLARRGSASHEPRFYRSSTVFYACAYGEVGPRQALPHLIVCVVDLSREDGVVVVAHLHRKEASRRLRKHEGRHRSTRPPEDDSSKRRLEQGGFERVAGARVAVRA